MKALAIIGAVFVAVLIGFGACVAVVGSSMDDIDSGPQPAIDKPAQTDEGAGDPPGRIADGTYEAGVDIDAGSWKTNGESPAGACYWERAKDDSGEFGAIIANHVADGPGRLTVKEGEFLSLTGGCTWELIK